MAEGPLQGPNPSDAAGMMLEGLGLKDLGFRGLGCMLDVWNWAEQNPVSGLGQ